MKEDIMYAPDGKVKVLVSAMSDGDVHKIGELSKKGIMRGPDCRATDEEEEMVSATSYGGVLVLEAEMASGDVVVKTAEATQVLDSTRLDTEGTQNGTGMRE
ncbi:unnamed protein product, partial [Prorocentrum cordatum]